MQTGIGHLVWLGAGRVVSPQLKFSDYARVTLVDARKKCCSTLEKRFTQKNINILNLAVSRVRKESTFKVYSIESLSALSSASGLFELYPGLIETAKEKVTTCAVHQLIEKLELENDDNTLIIDVIDETMPIIEGLVEHNLLSLFSKVIVTTPKESLYNGCSSSGKYTELLFKYCYKLVSVDNTDPDLPRQLFEIDVVRQKVINIEKAIGDLNHSLTFNSALNEKLSSLLAEERQARINAENNLARLKDDYNRLVTETLNVKDQVEVLKEIMLKDNKNQTVE